MRPGNRPLVFLEGTQCNTRVWYNGKVKWGEYVTEKQKKFADEYLIDLNGTRAYMEVYKNVSKKTAGNSASRLLKKPEIREYIDRELEKIHSEKTADAREVMEYLTAVMRREKKESVVVTLAEEKSEYVPDEKGKMKRQVTKKEIPVTVEIPAKISDANKAAGLLGKRYRLFTDKVEVDNVARVIFQGEEEIKE